MEQEAYVLSEMDADFKRHVLPVCIIFGLYMVVGVVGNSFVLYVYTFKYPKTSYRKCVLLLGIVDLFGCLTIIPLDIVQNLHWYTLNSPEVCKSNNYFTVFTMAASLYVLFVTAVLRYRKVHNPLSWQVTEKWLHISFFIGIVIGALISVPAAILGGPMEYTVTYKETNITVAVCASGDSQYIHTVWPLLYIALLSTNLVIIIAMVILYVLLSKTVFRHSKSLKGSVNSQFRRSTRAQQEMTQLKTPSTSVSSLVSLSVSRKMSIHADKENSIENLVQKQNSTLVHSMSYCDVSSQSVEMKVKNRSAAIDRRKTLIMVLVSAIYTVTVIVMLVIAAVYSDKKSFFKSDIPFGFEVFLTFIFRLFFIHFAINPIIYAFLDPTFKREVKSAITFNKKDKDTRRSYTVQDSTANSNTKL